MGTFSKIKGIFKKDEEGMELDEDLGEEYVELTHADNKRSKARVTVRPFIVEDFTDIKPILDSLREGVTIALVNIRPLKEKDIIELKRAVSKLKKTCDAINGDIAGFGEDWVVVTPSFAQIFRTGQTEDIRETSSASEKMQAQE
ncbi:cell division protein SepF [Candidatus Woesearchaeota archaeon]|nr:cell division protein SepF [Candidatus Woesearchaeota archaeon]